MFQPLSITGKLFKKYLLLPDHPGKIRFQNILGRLLFPRGIFLQNKSGVKISADANDWMTRIILQEGSYERRTLELAVDLLKGGGVFIDIGANFGLFTSVIGYATPASVTAVDPNYKIIGRLLSNISLNKIEDKVTTLNMAISSSIEWVSLNQASTTNLGSTYTTKAKDIGLTVFGCPLEFICERLCYTSIQLIKIDIEGNEYEILENFPFEKVNVNNIIMEYNEHAKISFSILLEFFKSKGYKCFSVDRKQVNESKDGLIENNLWFAKM